MKDISYVVKGIGKIGTGNAVLDKQTRTSIHKHAILN